MRITTLVAVLGLSLIGCVGQIDSPGSTTNPGGGDDTNPGGDDTGSNGSGSDTTPTPALASNTDKPTVATELASTQQITLTVTGSGDFSGTANVVASAMDANNTPITDWTVELMSPSMVVPLNGTATAIAVLKIPSDSTMLAGTVKFTVTSGALTTTTSSAVTTTKQVTLATAVAPNGCAYPVAPNSTLTVHVGTKIRFLNTSANVGDNITIHINDNAATPPGMSHQQGASIPNASYDQTPTGTGDTKWYCHDRDPSPPSMAIHVVQ
jgi:plastocyanin